jgi:hypoxanthine phosphoribosyltransferase
MSNIPFAREILKSALDVDDISDVRAYINSALKYMTREKHTRKAAPASEFVTEEKRVMVWYYAKENPDASMQSIASLFNVNIGRVSEILAGKR